MDNKDFFNRKFGDVYIPDNTEGVEDNYTFESLEEEAQEFWSEYSKELSYDNIELFINDVISILDWQFPSTVMVDILNRY